MPQLVINVTEGSLDGLLASLKRKELDLVLARLSPETHQPPFTTEPLYAESLSHLRQSQEIQPYLLPCSDQLIDRLFREKKYQLPVI
mgnify:CR=1 FL=1